jgi:hypothetical protein
MCCFWGNGSGVSPAHRQTAGSGRIARSGDDRNGNILWIRGSQTGSYLDQTKFSLGAEACCNQHARATPKRTRRQFELWRQYGAIYLPYPASDKIAVVARVVPDFTPFLAHLLPLSPVRLSCDVEQVDAARAASRHLHDRAGRIGRMFLRATRRIFAHVERIAPWHIDHATKVVAYAPPADTISSKPTDSAIIVLTNLFIPVFPPAVAC